MLSAITPMPNDQHDPGGREREPNPICTGLTSVPNPAGVLAPFSKLFKTAKRQQLFEKPENDTGHQFLAKHDQGTPRLPSPRPDHRPDPGNRPPTSPTDPTHRPTDLSHRPADYRTDGDNSTPKAPERTSQGQGGNRKEGGGGKDRTNSSTKPPNYDRRPAADHAADQPPTSRRPRIPFP